MIKSKPRYPFQEKVNRFAKPLDQIGMFTFYGSGKTYMSLQWLENRQIPFPALVLCMKTNMGHWISQTGEHSDFHAVSVAGNSKKRLQILKSPADMYIVNHDVARGSVLRRYLADRVTNKPYRSIVIDESTAFKDRKSVV